MITLFNAKTVYLGKDMKKFNEVRDYLECNHIKYKYKVRNRMSQWNGRDTIRSRTGSFGNSTESMYEYEVLVHKNDYDKVKI